VINEIAVLPILTKLKSVKVDGFEEQYRTYYIVFQITPVKFLLQVHNSFTEIYLRIMHHSMTENVPFQLK